uniref:Histidinol-phosphatase n=1 Tax=Kwoniella pini CBS 10737 TaxID=1296096 RepID=A0A1B9IDS4_9TREE|nr:uncharacterized protein I206_01002 [Kwoniella pini CBS 10737]OCF53696.1 hypothetical protein I206_01002 [Kwoniella pini CBS 10737]
MPHSHHSHSGQFCRHAKDNLEEVVQEAIRQGFQVYGLSEHAPRYRVEDLFPEEADLQPSDLLKIYLEFLSTAKSLKLKYASKIKLLISIETDYITEIDFIKTSKLLKNEIQNIDYIVGSVHHVNGISIDFNKLTFLKSIKYCKKNEQEDLKEEEIIIFLNNYFDQQFNLIYKFKPEIIGHFDLCLLWIPNFNFKKNKLIWEKIKRNLKKVIEYGGLFEANSASLRKGWNTSYPSKDILNLIVSLGGKICLSDDSHGISYVGLNYKKMRDYLVDQGVTEIWYLVSSVEDMQEGDEEIKNDRGKVFARKMVGWDKHPFWNDK